MRDLAVQSFTDRFHRSPKVVVRSPGRVNLIGDHTDYNDGFVLPVAIAQALWIASGPRRDRQVQVTSVGQGSGTVDLDVLSRSNSWLDYVAGTLREIGLPLEHGFDALIVSDLPAGAGLSSSAALELGVARVAYELSGSSWDATASALAAQRAENDFVGVRCGIMDQLIVARAVSGHAGLIDCRSLEIRLIPVRSDVTLVILDTGTRRALVESRYQDLLDLCHAAARALGVPALRDATIEQIESIRLEPPVERVARHVIEENQRTLEAASALEAGEVALVGRLMDDSHFSLRDLMSVSSPELDAITEMARNLPGCVGARLTGAGFAGCAVALVMTDLIDDFLEEVRRQAPRGVTSYPTSPASGVAVV